MYPDFRYIAHYLLGIENPWPWLSIFKTFGFFVALAFIAAAWAMTRELQRKQKQGLFVPVYTEEETGKPASFTELIWISFLGFIAGFKVGGIIQNWQAMAPNPMGYIFTMQGSIVGGIAGALLLGWIRYSEKKKAALPEPKTVRVAVYPHQRVSEFVLISAIAGVAGAKIFNAFETWDDFIRDPAGNLLNSSGLTFYGGLITAALAMYLYARKYKIPFAHLCDATAPSLMLAYGVGRLGCQFAGDGDWGIFNSAYITDVSGHLQAGSLNDFTEVLKGAHAYFISDFGSLAQVPHAHTLAPGWLPDWLFAMNFPHNVNREGIDMTLRAKDMLAFSGQDEYNRVLPVGVYPTALYEAVVSIGLFFILWSVRRKIARPFHLFGIYLIMNGVERFFIEKIRVNSKYDWGFLHPTQAEIISVVMVLIGISIILFYKTQPKIIDAPMATDQE